MLRPRARETETRKFTRENNRTREVNSRVRAPCCTDTRRTFCFALSLSLFVSLAFSSHPRCGYRSLLSASLFRGSLQRDVTGVYEKTREQRRNRGPDEAGLHEERARDVCAESRPPVMDTWKVTLVQPRFIFLRPRPRRARFRAVIHITNFARKHSTSRCYTYVHAGTRNQAYFQCSVSPVFAHFSLATSFIFTSVGEHGNPNYRFLPKLDVYRFRNKRLIYTDLVPCDRMTV